MTSPQTEDEARRKYWAMQMDRAWDFMSAVLKHPVDECGEPFADLRQAAVDEGVDILFSQTKVAGRYDRIYWLRESVIADLIAVARKMNRRGWILKIEDAYRSLEIQRSQCIDKVIFGALFERVLWENHGQTPSPYFMWRRMSALIAGSAKVGTHISGSAVDISVCMRDGDGSLTLVDRGGSYLDFSERSPMLSPFISKHAADNRRDITEIMSSEGFVAYPHEFWHYSKGDIYDRHLNNTDQAASFGPVHFDPKTGYIEPIDNPETPLHSLLAIKEQIEVATQQISQECK